MLKKEIHYKATVLQYKLTLKKKEGWSAVGACGNPGDELYSWKQGMVKCTHDMMKAVFWEQ